MKQNEAIVLLEELKEIMLKPDKFGHINYQFQANILDKIIYKYKNKELWDEDGQKSYERVYDYICEDTNPNHCIGYSSDIMTAFMKTYAQQTLLRKIRRVD